MNRFPDLAKDLDLDLSETADIRKLVVDAITQSGECTVDYATDVEPWIGQRAAVAALPAAESGGEPEPVFVLQVTDEGPLARRSSRDSAAVRVEGRAGRVHRRVRRDHFRDARRRRRDRCRREVAAGRRRPVHRGHGGPGRRRLVSFWADLEGVRGLVEESLAARRGRGDDHGARRAGRCHVDVRSTARRSDHLELAFAVGADDATLEPLKGRGPRSSPGSRTPRCSLRPGPSIPTRSTRCGSS
ncbi:hypothetical protein NKG05_18805 [Oerskovia sp. M15]